MMELPHIKSNSGRYALMKQKYSNKNKGRITVVSSFIFFSFIIPLAFGYAIWRPMTLLWTFTLKQSSHIFWISFCCCWILFNIKVFEELIYSRKLLVISNIVLDICMIPTTILPFALSYDIFQIMHKLLFGSSLVFKTRKIWGFCILTISFILNNIGFYRGTHISTIHYTIKTKKLKHSKIRIAHISDIHIGSRLDKLPQKMVNKIIEENPDLVVITGDLIDSHNVISTDLASFNAFKERNIPIYYTIGNHDIMAGEEYVSSILEYYGIIYLKNQVTQITIGDETIQLVGIDDVQSITKYNEIFNSITPSIHNNIYTILLHHRPQGYKTSVQSGQIDLQLAGHTHDGQVFPFNYIVPLFHSKSYGMYHIKDTSKELILYTHPGSCAWGPHFRTAAKNLITIFSIESSN
ncbi:phosphoesterase, putative [Entamoeba histolytica HM-1:IMSS-B]|uniref:Phosphoesterase, putative n=5 Tax=Entamoeba histolytica TaxID=5759 RepID=C4LX82_ENTH1|nr:phosphoesterase, putative [Entamoeba histolytica HM-1:IMSS]EAL44257.1 phosphoesterase, putative [Entamoeba histolytica HM-1:IMSS]EMH76684.1 phosphoesterase, putative [Entamoeba histolytica HM-1:IMSS-B]ENY62686.1 phosphoesterase, putative [Entamoeba histolytica HM-1:IMSS-A]GAT93352.1 phosphoesterase putative [Entamoeba histolytica]|eukprot:XP_649643.1 phosphoesterase, putative [Entamoeba histolytica HM-1:IMSS]